MGAPDTSPIGKRFYRIDRFIVPEGARDEFLGRVMMTHEFLRKQPGFIQDFLLERPAGPGKLNILTFAEWRDADVVQSVRAAVAAMHKAENFDPQEIFARLKIETDLGNYRRIEG